MGLSHCLSEFSCYSPIVSFIVNISFFFIHRGVFKLIIVQTDLVGFSDAPDLNLRFLAMLAGPFYPILHLVNERLGYLACYISCFTCHVVSVCTKHFHFRGCDLCIISVSWCIEGNNSFYFKYLESDILLICFMLQSSIEVYWKWN